MDQRRRPGRTRLPPTMGGMAVAAFLILLFASWAEVARGQAGPPGPTANAAAVFRYRASDASYTNYTTAAQNAATNDVALGGAVNDAIYIGHLDVFDQVRFELGQAGASGAVQWQYRNATSWRDILPSDGTEHFRTAGSNTVSWQPQPDWARTELEASQARGSYYYVRARVTIAYVESPLASKIGLEVWRDAAAAYVQEGAAWLAAASPINEHDLHDVKWAGNAWVAAGSGGYVLRGETAHRWTRASLPFTNEVLGLAFSGLNGVVVGGSGKIATTGDGGKTWTAATSGTTKILHDVQFATPQLLVAVGDDTILRSTNGGQAWTATTRTGFLKAVDFVDAGVGYIVGENGTKPLLLKTTNGGAVWNEIPITQPGMDHRLKDVEFFNAGGDGWILGDTILARTQNDGVLWEPFALGSVNPKAMSFANDNVGWIVGDTGLVRRITEANNPNFNLVAFEDQDDPAYAAEFFKMVHANSTTEAIVVGATGVILHSPNRGDTWSQPLWRSKDALKPTLYDMDLLSNGVVWAVGDGGLVLRSGDRGQTWTRYPAGVAPTTTLRAVDFVGENYGWIAGDRGILRRTPDGGLTWDIQDRTTLDALLAVEFVDAAKGWAVGEGGKILRTTNGGTEWATVAAGTTNDLQDVQFVTGQTVVIVGDVGTVLRSTDSGASWSPVTSGTAHDLASVSFRGGSAGWAVGSGGIILATVNGGTSWTSQPTPPGTPKLHSVSVLSASSAWIVGDDGVVFKTNNGGQTWNSLTSPTGKDLFEVAGFTDADGLAVGDDVTALRTGLRLTARTQEVANPSVPHAVVTSSLSPDDALLVGQDAVFDSIHLNVNTTATGARVAWQYWDGAGWAGLNANDRTGNFSQPGHRMVKYPLPGNWAKSRVAGDTEDRYWVRAKFSVAPTDAFIQVAEVGTLRLLAPVPGPTQPTTPTSTTTTTQIQTTTSEVPGERFIVARDPAQVDFSVLERGQKGNRTITLVSLEGEGSASATLDGPDHEWFTLSASLFDLKPGINQSVRVEVHVPDGAAPGPHASRLFILATPRAGGPPISGWIPLSLTVAAADLVDVTYDADASAWAAQFANFLQGSVHVRLEASLQRAGQEPIVLSDVEDDVAANASETFASALDTAGLAAGPYTLVVTAFFSGTSSSQQVTIYLGGPPVEVRNLQVSVVGAAKVEFRFQIENRLDTVVPATPRVVILDSAGVAVETVQGTPLDVGAHETRDVLVEWAPIFGVFTARATVAVENAKTGDPVEQTFAVRTGEPEGPNLGGNLVLFVVATVIVVNVLVGLGLWTGQKKWKKS